MDFVGGGGFSFNFLPEAEEAHPPQISKQSIGGAGDAQSIEPEAAAAEKLIGDRARSASTELHRCNTEKR